MIRQACGAGYRNASRAIDATQRAYLGASLPKRPSRAWLNSKRASSVAARTRRARRQGSAARQVLLFRAAGSGSAFEVRNVVGMARARAEARRWRSTAPDGSDVRSLQGSSAWRRCTCRRVRKTRASPTIRLARSLPRSSDAAEPWTNAEPVASIAVERLALAA